MTGGTSWRIRTADAGDADRLAALVAAAFADVARQFGLSRATCPTHPAFATGAAIRRSQDRGTVFLLARLGAVEVGCIGVRHRDDGTAVIEKLAVLPAFRRRGLGRRLVEEAVALARQAGARRVELAIIAGHHALRAWYGSQGFAVLDSRAVDHLPFAVLVMERALDR
ncbi:GNAT family N-acetyltransferase [Azospirillum sp. A39]|uniref:GNAT family N-acetyltransferase n=1 Tax=Azospirillum sp. A39 TaxID=3462279 RepID=UPI004045B812